MTWESAQGPVVTVIGAGAMGTLFAARLASAGTAVQVVVRTQAQANEIAQQGLRLVGPAGDAQTARPAAVLAADQSPDRRWRAAGLIIVAVKAYSTVAVAPLVASLLTESTDVLTVQNGLGNPAALAAGGVPQERILVGVTTEGATGNGPGTSWHRGFGHTMIGPYLPVSPKCPLAGLPHRCSGGLAALAAAGFSVEWRESIEPYIWAKLAVNVAINPISALLGAANGALLLDSQALGIMREAVAEVQAVAVARGVALPAGNPWQQVLDVLRATATNQSSMLQDLRHGRPTEIDAMCGAVAREGLRLGIPAPVNDCLRAAVGAAERRGLARGEPIDHPC